MGHDWKLTDIGGDTSTGYTMLNGRYAIARHIGMAHTTVESVVNAHKDIGKSKKGGPAPSLSER